MPKGETSSKDSSSDDSTEFLSIGRSTPKNRPIPKDGRRMSDRISSRKKRRFTMPSRDDVLDKIDSAVSPNSSYLCSLQPRKPVNDFTKENSCYNYDPNLTDGESSIENFLKDDSSSSSSGTGSSSGSRGGSGAESGNEREEEGSESESIDKNLTHNGIIDDDDSANSDPTSAPHFSETTPRSLRSNRCKRRRLALSLSGSDEEVSPKRQPSLRAALMEEKKEQKFHRFRSLVQLKNDLIESDSD